MLGGDGYILVRFVPKAFNRELELTKPVCGCMSLPVALSVWFSLPDYPHNTKAWYLTEADKKLALERGARYGKVEITGKIDMALAKRMFGNWRWWVLCAMYIFVSLQHLPRSVLIETDHCLV